jgi:hypothetical protein
MNIREHIFFILFGIFTIPFIVVALPFLLLGVFILFIGVVPLLVWHYTLFPTLIWFEEWFVRKGYYIKLREKNSGTN